MTADIKKGPFWGQRHTQTVLLFLAITANYISKYNASVAVVAMTNAETTNPDFDEYDWNEKEKSYILSSFFWGYVITQFPGAYLARRFGVKCVIFVATLGSAMTGLLVPFCVPWGGWQIYCAIRVVQGLFQGPLFPCLHAHLASWCPVNERNRLGALANSGIECGTVLAMFLSGMIAASSMGWPGISYVSCSIGVAWCVLWLIWGSNTPSKCKSITAAEREYIISSKNAVRVDRGTDATTVTPARKIPVPWKAMLTSLPFWALVQVRIAQSWGFNTLQAEIPSYMHGVLYMDMTENAVFSALPYLTMWFMSYIYLFASDILLHHNILSLTALRKTFNSLAYWIPAIVLLGIGFLGEENKTLAVVLMTLNVGFNAGCTIGSALNTIDLSSNHAGVIMSVVNTLSNCVPIVTPLVVGVIVTDEHDRTQWQIVFMITAIIFALSNLLYVIFGKMETQPWDAENFLLPKDIPNEKADIKPIKELQTDMVEVREAVEETKPKVT